MSCSQDGYTVIRDTREQQGWVFQARTPCLGTEVRKLDTGDYSLVGWERVFTIERKQTVSEFANNLFEARFERELVRLDEFAHPYLFLEFELADLMRYPEGSGIPKYKWKYIRVTPQLLLKRYHEIRLEHPTLRVEFVGRHGKEAASSLFKRIIEHVPPG